jgi:hypothetical protein
MAQCDVLIWNLQDFGASLSTVPGKEELILQFMDYLQQQNFDVLIIQELRSPGRFLLPKIAEQLGGGHNDWTWDYVPGAINTNARTLRKRGANLTFDDFGFLKSGRCEGYGVVARDHLLEPFAHNHSWLGKDINGEGVINLLLRGVAAKFGGNPIIKPSGSGQIVDAWFPIARPDRAPTRAPTPRKLRPKKPRPPTLPLTWAGCRRPCHVRVRVGNRIVDVLTYHAPISADGSKYGTLAFGLARPIWDGSPFVVVGGDFNLAHSSAQRMGLANFLRQADPPLQSGTGQPYDFEPSMVWYTKEGSDELRDPNDDCLGSPRDFVFHRGFPTAPQGQIWNILTALRNDTTLRLQNNQDIQNCVKGWVNKGLQGNKPKIPPLEQPLAIQLRDFVFKSRNLHPFPNTLSAAYFYRNFISDHLPVAITLNDF